MGRKESNQTKTKPHVSLFIVCIPRNLSSFSAYHIIVVYCVLITYFKVIAYLTNYHVVVKNRTAMINPSVVMNLEPGTVPLLGLMKDYAVRYVFLSTLF